MMLHIPEEHVLDLLDENSELYEQVESKITGTWRWGNEHRLIFRDKETNVLYALHYRSTSGDEGGIDVQARKGLVECYEVERTEVTVIKYIKKKEIPIAAWPSKSTSSSTPLPQPAESSSTPIPESVKPT